MPTRNFWYPGVSSVNSMMMLWTVQAVYSAVQLPFLVVFLFFVFFLLLTLSQTGFVPDADNKACADIHPLHENEQATLSSHSPLFWSMFFLRIRGWCSFEYLVFCWSRWPVGLLFLWQCLCHFAITNIILDFIIIWLIIFIYALSDFVKKSKVF